MNYLLDTCVLSEFTRRAPHPAVVRWLAEADEQTLFLCAISVGEIQRGIERLPESHRKEELAVWLNDHLLNRFTGRILPLDTETLLHWGSLTARMECHGRPMPAFDALIAASALRHHLMLVTRNVSDFEPAGVLVINPWQ